MRFLYVIGILVLSTTTLGLARDNSQELVVLLGQQCVSEISLSLRVEVPAADRLQQKFEECRLMWHVQLAKVDGDMGRLGDHTREYNTLLRRRVSSGSRQWILELDETSQQPPSWPDTARWSRYEETWQQILIAAREFIDEPGPHPCPAANQYGGRCDDDAHACDPVPICWKRQWCGRKRIWWSQAYWHRPDGGCKRAISAKEAMGG